MARSPAPVGRDGCVDIHDCAATGRNDPRIGLGRSNKSDRFRQLFACVDLERRAFVADFHDKLVQPQRNAGKIGKVQFVNELIGRADAYDIGRLGDLDIDRLVHLCRRRARTGERRESQN